MRDIEAELAGKAPLPATPLPDNMNPHAMLQELSKLKAKLKQIETVHADLRKEACERIEELGLLQDVESAHKRADEVLREFLRAIGAGDLAAEHQAAAENWYYG